MGLDPRRSKSCSSLPQTNTTGLFSRKLRRQRSHHFRYASNFRISVAEPAPVEEVQPWAAIKAKTKLVASTNAEAMKEAAREFELIAKRKEREQAKPKMKDAMKDALKVANEKIRKGKAHAAGLAAVERDAMKQVASIIEAAGMFGLVPQSGASVYADRASSSGVRPPPLSPLPVGVTAPGRDALKQAEGLVGARNWAAFAVGAVPPAPCQRPIIAGLFNGLNFPSLPSYGPVFNLVEDVFFHRLKEEIYFLVSGNAPGSTDFIEKIKSDIGEAGLRELTNAYANGTSLGVDEFLNILIRDACFFNALVLYYFGANLGYPPDHAVFGRNRDTNKLREWLESMFVPGNQIPTLMLRKVMSEHFFRGVIEHTREWKEPSGLIERVLFDSLLQPAISNDQGAGWGDLLQDLHSKMVGPGADRNQGHVVLDMPYGRNAAQESAIKFGSASELKHLGVCFKVADGNAGCRGIDFKKYRVSGMLSLPLLEVDCSTEFLFRCLLAYEDAQNLRKREVSSYCILLGDLVPSIEDARILESKGIIEGEIEELPRILGCLPRDPNRLTRELHTLKLKIDDCTRSIKKLKKYAYSGLMLVATVGGLIVGGVELFK